MFTPGAPSIVEASHGPTQQPPGILIAVCGIDGSGKSTLVTRMSRTFEGRLSVVRKETRNALDAFLSLEPDGGREEDWAQGAFVGAVAAATAFDFLRHHDDVIAPLLDQGSAVLADRYAPCYATYLDGTRSKLDGDALFAHCRRPDLVVLVDVPLDVAVARQRGRGGSSPDEAPAVLKALREVYLQRAAKEPATWKVLDNTQPLQAAQDQLANWIEAALGRRTP